MDTLPRRPSPGQEEQEEEIRESTEQLRLAWCTMIKRARGGTIEDLPGLLAVYANGSLGMLNVIFVTDVLGDAQALRVRVRAAIDYATDQGVPWMFVLGKPQLAPALHATAPEIVRSEGLVPTMPVRGMVADALLPPRRPLPALTYRRFPDEGARQASVALNAAAYGMALEPFHSAFEAGAVATPEDFGVVGYVGETPVSTTVTFPLHGRLYVSLVATHPEHQRHGYAEAVMRVSLTDAMAKTGLQRSVLHATDAGEPVYQAMGYRTVTEFIFYATAPLGHE